VLGFGDRVSKGFGSFRNAFGALAGPLAGIASAGALKGVIDDFDRIGEQAERLNVTATSLQRIGYQAKFTGTETEVVIKALERLDRQIQSGNGKALTALKDLNVDAGKLAGLAPEQKLIELAGAFQAAEAKGQGLSQLNTLFGKQYGELLPLLRKTKEELEAISNQEVVSEAAIKAAGDFNDALDKMNISARAFGGEVIAGLSLLKGQVENSLDPKSIEPFEQRLGNIARLLFGFVPGMQGEVFSAKTKQSLVKEAEKKPDEDSKPAQEKVELAKAEGEASKVTAENAKKKADMVYGELSTLEKMEVIRRKLDHPFESAKQFADPLRAAQIESERLDLIKEEIQLKKRLTEEEKAFSDMVDSTNEAIQRAKDDEAQSFSEMVDQENTAIERQKNAEADLQKEHQAAQAKSRQDLAAEIAILEAKAAGQDKITKQLEKEQRIRAEAAKIANDTGLDGATARGLAEKVVGLQDAAAEREDSGGRRKIRGANAEKRARALGELDAGGLEAFDERQKTRLRDTFKFPGLDAFKEKQKNREAFGGGKAEADRAAKEAAVTLREGPEILAELKGIRESLKIAV
jgi:hypothetical protein